MTTKRLVKLANSNDPLLAKYSERWRKEKNKYRNPVTTALWVFEARLFGWPTVLFCMVLSMIGSQYGVYALSILPIGVIVGTLTTAILNREYYKDMLTFCKAINKIELKIGQFGLPQEGEGGLTDFRAEVLKKWKNECVIVREGEAILLSEAKVVKDLQSFPWRKSEAEKLRAELEANLSLIRGIAPVNERVGYYFE